MIDKFIQQMRDNDRQLEELKQETTFAPVGGTAPSDKAPQVVAELDFTRSRAAYEAAGVNAGFPCPNCRTPVVEGNPVYLAGLADSKGQVIDQFYLNADIGLFCPSCPTALIDSKRAETFLKFNTPAIDEKLEKGCKTVVFGVVVETDAQTNQTKIVPFNSAAVAAPAKEKTKKKSKRKPKKKKTIKKRK